MKKQYLTALAAASALAVTLTGCSVFSGEEPPQATPSTSTTALTEVDRNYQGSIPEVSGEFGKTAEISAGEGKEPTTIVAHTIKEGTGKEVAGDDFVSILYQGALWDGTVFDGTFAATANEESRVIAFDLSQLIVGWQKGLAGQHVGDRVELIIPSKWGYGDQDQEKIPAGSTLVFVIDIIDALSPTDLSSLEGATTTSEPLPDGISVTGNLSEKPEITVDENLTLPAGYEYQVLATGQGEKVSAEDFLVFHSSVAAAGLPTQSTWDVERPTLVPSPVGQTPGLVSMPIGSRVLLVRPSPEGPRIFVTDLVGVLHSKVTDSK